MSNKISIKRSEITADLNSIIDYSAFSLKKLKEIGKELNLIGYSTFTGKDKEILIDLIRIGSQNRKLIEAVFEVNKSGNIEIPVILTEKKYILSVLS